jgi:hypothetical protein
MKKKDNSFIVNIVHLTLILISCLIIFKTINFESIKNINFYKKINFILIFILISINLIIQSYILFLYIKNVINIKINYNRILNIHLKSSLTNIGLPFFGITQKYFLLAKHKISNVEFIKIHINIFLIFFGVNLTLHFIESALFIFKINLFYIFLLITICALYCIKNLLKKKNKTNKKFIIKIIFLGIFSHLLGLLIYYLSFEIFIENIETKKFFIFFIINFLFETIPFFGKILGLSELIGGLTMIHHDSMQIGIMIKTMLRLIIVAALINLLVLFYSFKLVYIRKSI